MNTNPGKLLGTTILISTLAALCIALSLAGCAEEPIARQPTVRSQSTLTREQQVVTERRALAGGRVEERRIVGGKVVESRYVAQPSDAAASDMTLWQARRVMVDKILHVIAYREEEGGGFLGGSFTITDFSVSGVRVFPDRIEYDYRLARSTRGYTCPQGNPLCSGQQAGTYRVTLKKIDALVLPSRNCSGSSDWCLNAGGKEIDSDLVWNDYEDAKAAADALNRLVMSAHGERTPDEEAEAREFSQKAAAWRALPVKPAISEEVRRHRLLAENAIKEQRFDSAIEEYEAGLTVSPTWPEGHFNVALLCAELGYYSMAIDHMRAYLELVPNAPDAQSARDQITIWESKIPKD